MIYKKKKIEKKKSNLVIGLAIVHYNILNNEILKIYYLDIAIWDKCIS